MLDDFYERKVEKNLKDGDWSCLRKKFNCFFFFKQCQHWKLLSLIILDYIGYFLASMERLILSLGKYELKNGPIKISVKQKFDH